MMAGAMPTPGRGGEAAITLSTPATFAGITAMMAEHTWV
jgi:hypothetical protein